MHRFPPLEISQPVRAVAKPIPLPLPSLPWAEIAVFGLMAAALALS